MVFIVLLTAGQVHSQQTIQQFHQIIARKRYVSVADYCSSCPQDDAANRDISCEDFEGANAITNDGSCAECNSAWTATEDGDNTVTCGAHDPAFGAGECSDGGSNAIIFYAQYGEGEANDGEDCYISDTLDATGTVKMKLYFNWTSRTGSDWSDVAWTNYISVFRINASGTNVINLQLTYDGSDMYARMVYRNDTPSNVTKTFSTALAMDTWYEASVTYITGDTAEVTITNGDQSVNETETDNGDVQTANATALLVGIENNVSEFWGNTEGEEPAAILQVDNIALDNDTLPTSCTGW